MPRTVIRFAESALRDLEALRAWYAELGVPEVGARLADHSDMGRVAPEFDQPFQR